MFRQRVWAPTRDWLDVHGRFVLALAVLTLLAGLPLFQFKEMSGHDSNAYVPRFVEFYEGLKGGAIVPRWAPDLAWGYGEPTFSFNPPLLYYIGSFYHALGFTFIASENLSAFTLLFLAGFGMYLLASDFFGRHGGLVAATAYVYAPFVLVRLYVNHSLADFAAFAFLPFAFWGLHGAVEKNSTTRWAIATLAIAALILSSTSVTVITFPALVACVLWVAWCERSVRGLARGAWSLLLAGGLAAFLWAPGLLEADAVHITRREHRFNLHDHFLNLTQLIHSDWGYGLSPHGYSFELGAVQLVLGVTVLVLFRRIWRISRRAGVILAAFSVFTGVAIFMTTSASAPIWDHVSLLRPMQFPWRFLSLVALTTSFACGAPFLFLRGDRERYAVPLMVVLIAAVFLLNFRHANPSGFEAVTDATYSPANITGKGLPATERELEPIDVQVYPPTPRTAPMSVLTGRATIEVTGKTPTDRKFRVRVDERALLRMNTFYFPGWTLYVDGTQQPIAHTNQNGLMDFSLGQGTHAVRFVFLSTPTRSWSTRVSIVAALLFVLTPIGEYAGQRWMMRRRQSVARDSKRPHIAQKAAR